MTDPRPTLTLWEPATRNDLADVTDSTLARRAPLPTDGSGAYRVACADWPAWKQQLLAHAAAFAKFTPVLFHDNPKDPDLTASLTAITDLTVDALVPDDPARRPLDDVPNPPPVAFSLWARLTLDPPDPAGQSELMLPLNAAFHDPDGYDPTPTSARLVLARPFPSAPDLADLLERSFFLYDPDYEDYATQQRAAARQAIAHAAIVLEESLAGDDAYHDRLRDLITDDLAWSRRLPHPLAVHVTPDSLAVALFDNAKTVPRAAQTS